MQHCIVSDVTLPQAVLHTDHWMQTMLSGCAALDMTVANDVRPCSTRHEDQGKSQVSLLATRAGCAALPVLWISTHPSCALHLRSMMGRPFSTTNVVGCKELTKRTTLLSSTGVAFQTGRFFLCQQTAIFTTFLCVGGNQN